MQQLLYGSNSDVNIVAIHPSSDQTMRVYLRIRDRLAYIDEKYYPFFFLSDSKYISKFHKHYWIKELDGNNPLRYIVAFSNWSDMWEGVRSCINEYNQSATEKIQSFQELPVIYLRPDPVVQFLKQSGRTLFKSMKFDELHRMQIEILTLVKQGFSISNAERPEDKIAIIALSDNRNWKKIVSAKEKKEKDILKEAIDAIQQRDPDIIEGNFLSSFILPYFITRCRIHQIDPAIGRDGSTPGSSDSRIIYSEKAIAGRHIIDIQLLHESTENLKFTHDNLNTIQKLIQECGGDIRKQTIIPIQRRNWTWENDPDILINQCMQTLEDIKFISNNLLPPYFILAQMLPFNLESIFRLSGPLMIDSLILRDYITRKHSIPSIQSREQINIKEGEIFSCGVYTNVMVLDIKALITSLILNENISLESDNLHTYENIVKSIIGLYKQNHKKILIKSNYQNGEYLHANYKANIILIHAIAEHFFNNKSIFHDSAKVGVVYTKLRQYLDEIIKLILSSSGVVIHMDMDELYFVPPENISNEEKGLKYIRELGNSINKNLLFRISNNYKAMFSYKKNNYALLLKDGRIKINGNSLIPKNIEGFGKSFLSKSIEALLHKDINKLHEVYLTFHKNIEGHRLKISDFQRTETLTETKKDYLEQVSEGKRSRSPAYEAAINSKIEWIAGDKISYYLRGDDPNPKNFELYRSADEWDPAYPDENSAYYLKRLDEISYRFESFFSPQDFHAIFSSDDLFGFTSEGKTIINTPIAGMPTLQIEEDDNKYEINPKIWLDL